MTKFYPLINLSKRGSFKSHLLTINANGSMFLGSEMDQSKQKRETFCEKLQLTFRIFFFEIKYKE